jgi:bifunctional non-homologous end joining protein LigD
MSVAVPVAAGASVTGTVTHVTITNADKRWWPDDGLTKADVARHYARVADRLLPWTTDRPLTVERCPDGMLGRCFYQKNFASAEKLGVPTRAIRARTANRTVHYPVGNDLRTVLLLVNLGGLSLHLMNCRARSLSQPDWLAFDLDPPARFADAVRAAHLLRDVLVDLGLRGYPKTTGGKGLHVLVPLRPGHDHAAVLGVAEAVADRMAAAAPDVVTRSFARHGRGGRVYLDVGRNVFGATIVAPYAVRRRPHAPVSTPLAWTEVRADLDPATLNLRTTPARLTRPDAWRGFWSDLQELPRAGRGAAPARRRRRRSAA